MTAPILITGGTGTLGRQVVPRLRDAGRELRVLSRGGGESVEGIELVTGDLTTGQGVDAAVDGAEIIVHLAGTAKGDAATGSIACFMKKRSVPFAPRCCPSSTSSLPTCRKRRSSLKCPSARTRTCTTRVNESSEWVRASYW